MPYETSAFKHFVNTVLTWRGAVSMYIYGDGLWNTWQHFELLVELVVNFKPTEEVLVNTLLSLLNIYTPALHPFWIIASIFVFVPLGGIVASLKWYVKYNLYRSSRGRYNRRRQF